MLPIVTLIISALTFQQIASEMKMTEFFIAITRPVLSAHLFPMIAFIIVSVLAFMIANAWGVCSRLLLSCFLWALLQEQARF